ncbi:YggS family pyridoxal phosphate-dependent enzyme [Corynebacterium sp. LK2510]|uniref:YggS family pyridoxal phosphate-dependent enzyme n=1 Tax=Corynebacterium sp. LK2510 TaxID=3110472 RepID=UPI0034CE41D6
MTRKDELKANLEAVRARIRAAESAAGRAPGSARLLPVSKFHPVEDVRLLAELGVDLVGENREQEARAKAEELAATGTDIGIAMIGQIQSKKANAVARWAREVHSLDSIKLAHGLDRGMELALERDERTSDTLPCLVQLSADGDAQRGGVAAKDVDDVVDAVLNTQHLKFAGFMVVPPLDADPTEVFTHARSLTDAHSDSLGRPLVLSAGMSGDFEQAIACGSDIVRVGTGVLGPRSVG